MTIKAVLFDLGGTILDFNWKHPAEIYQKVLFSLGISKSFDEAKAAFLKAEKEAKDINLFSSYGKIDQKEYSDQWGALVLKHLGLAENLELVRTVQSKWDDFTNFTIYPEAKDVLLELQQRGLKLGLISNGYEDGLHRLLRDLNLGKSTFDIVVGIDTVQCMKPHPDIFKYALRKLKVRPEEALFVGDELEVDYNGAKNVGIQALLIDRAEKQKQGDLRTIKNLKDVLPLVGDSILEG
ncbi:MAG: HAD family hydrolase [Candidatus Bathyarchaeota archaeon]|nr:MAG: HAD family hydrolase [Candidatus Bathyarchaeota archaeon]